jgi:hypothetical protein
MEGMCTCEDYGHLPKSMVCGCCGLHSCRIPCKSGYPLDREARPPHRPLKRTITYDGKSYEVKSDTIELPDFESMSRTAALTWLCRHSYPVGTAARIPSLAWAMRSASLPSEDGQGAPAGCLRLTNVIPFTSQRSLIVSTPPPTPTREKLTAEAVSLAKEIDELTHVWDATEEVDTNLGVDVEQAGRRLVCLLDYLADQRWPCDQTRFGQLRRCSAELDEVVTYYEGLEEHDTSATVDIFERLGSGIALVQQVCRNEPR